MKIKRLLLFIVITVLVLMSFVQKNTGLTVVIDPSHGGIDKGLIYQDVYEKDIVLKIAHKIKTNSTKNVNIILLREKDQTISIHDRINRINDLNPDLLISLHTKNDNNDSNYELEINKSHEHFNESLRWSNRIVQSFNLKKVAVTNNATPLLLSKIKCPSIIFNIGNLNNPTDRNQLISSNGQTYIANGILKSLN